MTRTDHASPSGARRRISRATVGIVATALLAGVVLGGCSASDGGGTAAAAMQTMTPAPMATAAAAGGQAMADETSADADAMWGSRPGFVTQDPTTEEAYQYALYHPQVIEWMPCYCGCVKLDHRSNLDCYLTRGQPAEFEQHASFCGICVQTTLLAKQLADQGKSLQEIRQAVDAQFQGTAPGTDTAQPPA